MFHDIPQAMLERMAYLEAVDARDRDDGTPRARRLRQVPPETGRFLALLAVSAPPGAVVEVGASGGYSGLWLALACRERGDRLTTFDLDDDKALLARQTFAAAGVDSIVDLVHADALQRLSDFSRIAFLFLDAEKNLYPPCYDLVVPRLVPGGLFVADNLLSHQEELRSFSAVVAADPRMDALVVPIGKGVLVCRKVH